MTLLQTIKDKIDVTRATQYLLFLLIILIPFSIRHIFNTTWSFQTGAYSDFTSLSIYMSDVVLVVLGVSFIFSLKKLDKNFITSKVWLYFAGAAVIWLIIELILQSRQTFSLQVYYSVRIVFLIAFALIVSKIEVSREKLAWLFVILGGIQSLIAVIQFYTQKSIGLYLFGESHLSPETLGVAKIVSHGTTLIRGYGTFPHANLLSAFLVATLLFNIYLLIKSYQIPRGGNKLIALYALLLINTFGLFLTFSRGGILAFGVAMAIITGYFLINMQFAKIYHVVFPVALAIGVSIAILAPYLSTRTTISDTATKERLFYTEIGKDMIQDQPFTGLGPGTSVLHMKQYSPTELEPWEVQPIHNYYLIAWAEWGIGAIFLFALLIYPILALFKRNIDEWQLVLLATGMAFLTLFLFDHYFYTIWPTQLLLWLIVGLILKSLFHMKQD